MEVKPGYKLTEAGVIPEDWEVKHLGELADIEVGLSKPKIVFGSGCPVVMVQNLYEGSTINVAGLRRVVATDDEIQKFRLERGDVLIGNASVQRDGIGYANKFDGASEDVIFAKYLYRASNLRHLRPAFLLHYLRTAICRNWIISSSQTGTLTNLNKTAAAVIPIPLPSTKAEQERIEEVLNDADRLIESVEHLITKKRDLKQAAMQQLLTGQTRLPGFHSEWELKQLGELAEIISGGTPKTGEPSYWNGSIKWCTPTDITGCSGKYLLETERTISAYGLASCSAQLLPVGSLLLCSRATIGEIRIAGCEICTNQGFKSLVCEPGVSNEFLYYKLLTMKSHMVERAIGSTFLEISKKDTATLALTVPEYAEQSAIAEVLSDMDAELTALEQRRAKTRALKQGMMQELLTGRTRLV